MSGIYGEVGELEDILGMTAEARNELDKKRDALKKATATRFSEKDRIWKELVAQSFSRKRKLHFNCDYDLQSGSAKRKQQVGSSMLIIDGETELGQLDAALKAADMAQIEVERDRLRLKRKRMKLGKDERENERALRREERED